MTRVVDVAIVGAGPAGAAAAVRLATIGRSVVVVDRPGAASDELLQHIPSRAIAAFEPLGLRTAVETIAVRPDRPGELRWAGDTGPMTGDGLLVDRRELRRLLADRAQHAGVRRIVGRAGTTARCEDGTWVVPAAGARSPVCARVVIDARGHTPRWADRLATGPPTIALCVRWHRAQAPTLAVRALDESWVWAAAGGPARGGMTIQFVDASAGRLGHTALRRASLDVVGETAASVGLDEPGELIVRTATPARARNPAADHRICVGDAASSLDPLTGHGLIGAIRSGLHGAAVANTLLDPGGDDAVAHRFVTDRIAATHAAHAARCGDLYARQAEVSASRFWQRRAGTRIGPERRHPSVRLDSPVRWAPEARWSPTGVVVDDLVVERMALHHPALDAPTAFVAGRHAMLLRDCFRDGSTVHDGLVRAEAAGFGSAVVAVAVELMRRGVLVAATAAPRQVSDRAVTRSG